MSAELTDIGLPPSLLFTDAAAQKVAELIKERLKLQKGSGVPNRDKVGKLTRNDLKEIVKAKKADMRASSDEAAMRLVAACVCKSVHIKYVRAHLVGR
jgi:ribosomal protein L11